MTIEEIYQAHAKTVYRYLLMQTHNEDTAEELTQETFYQAIRSIERFDGSCKISTWLCAIAKNQLHAYQRKHPPTITLDSNDHITVSTETQVISNLNHMELLRMLHQFPEPLREVMHLRLFANLSFREIGDIHDKSENWARVTYYRGKEKLKKEMSKNE